MAEQAERRALPAGTEFDGRYRLRERLGGGGMGDVYLADEPRLERRCAVKVLHRDLAAQREQVERFLREARTMAQLAHPNIVNIYAFGEDPAGVYFAMELLAGEDLHARIRARDERPYSTMDAVVWGVEIARAVGVVHKAGIIHRDLKTSNIFLAESEHGETIKLLDFGIARPIEGSDLTATGVSLGTPSYMSPEQILSQPLDHRTDIYSLGVLLFKAVTGRMPFLGSQLEISVQHCTVAPPRPSAVAPEAGISRELDEVILKAMAKQPGDRHASMKAFEQALLGVLNDEQPTFARAIRTRRPTVHLGEARPAAADQGDSVALTMPKLAPPPAPPRSARTGWLAVTAVLMLGVLATLATLLWR